MADTDIEKALLTAAKTFLDANGFTGAINWENSSFDPSGATQWASVFFVPNVPDVLTLGTRGDDRMTGFLQIDLNVPQGTGSGAMRAWLNNSRQSFVAGKAFALDGYNVAGAGTAAANGFYEKNGASTDSRQAFTLFDTDGTTGLFNIWGFNGFAWFLTSTGINAGGVVGFYGVNTSSALPPLTGWSLSANGDAPAPTLSLPPKVTIISAGWGQGRNVDNWFRKSLTVAFRSDLQRANF